MKGPNSYITLYVLRFLGFRGLGFRVLEITGTLNVCKIMALMAVIMGLGL